VIANQSTAAFHERINRTKLQGTSIHKATRQLETLAAIATFVSVFQRSPTMVELGNFFLCHPESVRICVVKLIARGLVERVNGRITVTDLGREIVYGEQVAA
jgi:hypothetical protein